MPRNPFASSNPFAGEDWSGVGATRQAKPQFAPLPEPEAAAAKDGLINKGLSGLSWVGGTLDKAFGARAIRGAAMGDTREMKSIIPFSDTLGITDPSKSHSMDEVLQHHGIVGKNDPDRWEARDFLVPAAEIAADPGTYLSFGAGALTKGGVAAKAAGALPEAHKAMIQGFHATEPGLKALGQTDDVIQHAARAGQRIAPEAVTNAGVAAGQPLAGLVGFGLPGMNPAFTVGHGPTSQKIAGAFDSAKDAVKYSKFGAGVRGLFDNSAGRSFDPIAQQASEYGARPVTRQVQAATDRLEHQARFGLEPAIGGPGVPAGAEREVQRLLAQRTEGIAQAKHPSSWTQSFLARHAQGLTPGVTDPDAVARHVESNWDRIAGFGDQFNAQNKDWLAQQQRMGGQAADATTANHDYLARQYIGGPTSGTGAAGNTFLSPTTASDFARKPWLRDVPGGQAQINDWAINPALSGPDRTLDRAGVKSKVLNDMLGHIQGSGNLLTMTPEALADVRRTASGQATFLGRLNPLHAESQVPFYDPDVIGAMAMRGKRQAEAIGNMAGIYEGAGRGARPLQDGDVPLRQFLKQAGLKGTRPDAPLDPAHVAELAAKSFTPDQARALLQDSPTGPYQISGDLADRLATKGYEGAPVRMYEQLARHGVPFQSFATGGDVNGTLDKFGLAPQQAAALQQFMPGFQPKPHELSPAIQKFDAATNLFKNMVYPLWPASHVRNATSAVYNNTVNGTPLHSYLDASRVIGGRGIDDASRYAHVSPDWGTMDPLARSQLLHELAYAHAKVFQGAGGVHELVGRNGLESVAEKMASGDRLTPRVPGDSSHIFGDQGVIAQARERGLSSLDPRGQAGVFGRTEDTFAPLVAGRRIGSNTEDHVRMANFLGELSKGATPEVAGANANRVHFDYTDLTPFEREGMRRVAPFYTFMRKNLPAQANILATTPGKISAPIKALTNVDQNREGYTPDYLSSGVAIPMGQNLNPQTGRMDTRYLNKVGLPFEEALERMKFTNNLPNPVATMRSYLGSMNPLVKAPLEMATDTQFHSGRKLSDLRSEGVFGGLGMLPPEVAQPLTQILANSPVARFGTTADKLIDPRKSAGIKALNLLTGVGITDVDTDRLREVEARKEAEAALRRDPNVKSFTNMYVPAGQANQLSPEATKLMQLYSGMKADAKASAADQLQREKMRSILGPTGF